MKLYLEIKADTNDADYIYQRSEITEKELEDLKALIVAIKKKGKNHSHNWDTSEYGSDEPPVDMYSEFSGDLIEQFSEYVPNGEYGVHSIRGIKLLKVLSEETLL